MGRGRPCCLNSFSEFSPNMTGSVEKKNDSDDDDDDINNNDKRKMILDMSNASIKCKSLTKKKTVTQKKLFIFQNAKNVKIRM